VNEGIGLRSDKRVSQTDNEQASSIILTDPRRYDGLPVIWAQLWVEKAQGIIPQVPCGKDPLAELNMPNWTQADIDRRNLEVFGTDRPGSVMVPQDKPAKAPESLIEAECCRLLSEDGWRILKTDPVADRSRGKGFGEPGMADMLALRYGRQKAACGALWIEWKAPGGRVKKHQLEWHTKERARGAVTVIAGLDFAPSVKGFWKWYRASGLARPGR
jgi:hypothetical protein